MTDEQPADRRPQRLRVLTLVGGVVVALALVAARQLAPPGDGLPAVGGIHWVERGVLLRAGQPSDIAFVDLRDQNDVCAVLDLRGDTPLEEDVLAQLGVRHRSVVVPAGEAPTPKQVAGAVQFARAARAAGCVLLVHDEFGDDSAPAMAAMLVVLREGSDDREALAQRTALRRSTPEQRQALTGLVSAVTGEPRSLSTAALRWKQRYTRVEDLRW